MFWLALRHIRGFLMQMLLILTLDLAFGAITYFTLKSFTSLMDSPGAEVAAGNMFSFLIIGNGIEAFVTVIIIRLFGHFNQKIRLRWLRYILLAVSIFVITSVAYSLLNQYDTFWISLLHFSLTGLIYSTNIIAAGLLAYAYQNYDRVRTRKISDQQYQLLELKELKTKAELEALQAKINPHFLYNSLNAIASLIHENPDKAEQMVLLLAKFFRYSTNAKSQYLTRLTDELEMVKTYLEVEKVRFDERLEYHLWLEKEELKNCLIPQFLLQPLVENAIKHGISRSMEKGILGIKVFDKGDLINIVIFDNGVPFPEQLITGYGLRSTQDKLRLLMGEDAQMEIINGQGNYAQQQNFMNQPHKAIRLTLKKQFLPSAETVATVPEQK